MAARREMRTGLRPWLHGVLVLGVLLAVCAPAYASAGAHHPAHDHWPPISAALVTVALGGAALAAAAYRSRRALFLALALLVAVFGLESAVHSFHHLSDPHGAASCAISAASQHLSGDCSPVQGQEAPTLAAQPSPPVDDGGLRPDLPHSVKKGRAPPVLPSA